MTVFYLRIRLKKGRAFLSLCSKSGIHASLVEMALVDDAKLDRECFQDAVRLQ